MNNTNNDISQSANFDDNKFFNYNVIDHYHLDFDLSEFNTTPITELEILKREIILGNRPISIVDTNTLIFLSKINDRQSTFNQTDLLDNFFVLKTAKEFEVASCVRIYRDVLIFKHDNQVVGTMKICFECGGHLIDGAKVNTDNFGQDGDYRKLDLILNPLNESSSL